MLNFQHFGAKTGTPLIIAHGLYGSGRNWGVIARRLSDIRPVVTVDMRNHGGSFWDDDHSYTAMAGDILQLADHFGGQCDLLGHSMGGKAAMMAALTRPDAISRLIVADMAPVVYSHTQMPVINALRAVDLTQVETRNDVQTQLEHHINTPETVAFLLQSLDLKEKRWRLNLDALAQNMDAIIGFPDVAGHYDGPTLFLSGGRSDYVKPEYRPTIKALFPKARFAKLPNAGHWLHAENPRGFEETARVFLQTAPE